jgi:transposase
MAPTTRETWAVRVREWKRSGLTAEQYAEREGFKASTLTWWSWQLKVRSPPAVLEVVMQAATDTGVRARSLEVVLTSGVRVAVPLGFDEATLRRLLSVMEGR